MAFGDETESEDLSEKLQKKRDRTVEEAVELAARRMDADEREHEILEEAAERLAERVTLPVVESTGTEESETVKRLFLDG